MRDNNKGFSLVELLVVIAILSVAVAGTTLSYSAVRSADVKKSATEVQEYLKSARTECLGKETPVYLYIYGIDSGDDKGYYYVISSEDKDTKNAISMLSGVEKLCSHSINITCVTESGNCDLSDSFAKITFDKGTGAVSFRSGSNSNNLTAIKLTRGSRESTITVAYETGKTTISNG